jgi:hypothetical protein
MKKLLLIGILAFSFSAWSQVIRLQEDFNLGSLPATWTTAAISGTQNWSFGINGSSLNAGNNNLDGTAMAFFDDDALGGGSINNTASLTSPVFDNSRDSVIFLQFDYNFREFGGPADRFYVEIYDGVSWNTVFSKTTNDCGSWVGSCTGNFPHANIDISQYRNTTCQIRFTYHDGNDWSWYVGIDNVLVKSTIDNDLSVTDILNPISACNLGATEQVQVQIKNKGGNDISSSFNITVDVNNGSQILTETIATSLNSGDSLFYTFTGTLNLASKGNYNIKAYPTFSPDSNSLNDTTQISIDNIIASNLPYSDGFEGTTLNWVSYGQNNSWAIGVPNGTFVDTAYTGTQLAVTNLNGNYNNSEISYLESPCINSSQPNRVLLLSFYLKYNSEVFYDKLIVEYTIDRGISWQKMTKGSLSQNWYANNSSWSGASNGWIKVQNSLNSLIAQNDIKFRFKMESDNSASREGFAIDKLELYYQEAFDLSIESIEHPSSSVSCGLGNEQIAVKLKNIGTNTSLSTTLYYSVNNGPVISEIMSNSLPPGALLNFTFNSPYNFSQIGTYTINAWISSVNDSIYANDSITNFHVSNTIPNGNLRTLPFVENFDGPLWGLGNGGGGNSVIAPNWSRDPNVATLYTWHVWNTFTNSTSTGPSSDFSGSGNYLYTEASGFFNPFDSAVLVTPCISIPPNTASELSFYTHGYGTAIPTLIVQVTAGTNTTNIATYTSNTQTSSNSPWTKRSISLNQFSGRRIQVKFVTAGVTSFQGDLAIDNVEINRLFQRDIKVNQVLIDNITCTPSGDITIEVENFGSLAAFNFPLSYQINNGPVVTETYFPALISGAVVPFTFSTKSNISSAGQTYSIKAWSSMPLDSNRTNDSTTLVYKNQTKTVGYKENFESFVDGTCLNNNISDVLNSGWIENSTGNYHWNVRDLNICFNPSSLTGTYTDHTLGLSGTYIYTESSGSSSGIASIESPCIKLNNSNTPGLEFWYHMFGNSINRLIIDVYANGVWNNGVDQIVGQTQFSNNDPWLKRQVNLTQFAGQAIKVRFRGLTPYGSLANIAIDDIGFTDLVLKDAGVVALESPGIGSCINLSQPLVSIRNYGILDISQDSMLLFYQIDGGQIIQDTLDFLLRSQRDSSFLFTVPASFTQIGKTYQIKIWTSISGDENSLNDTLFTHYTNQTKALGYFESFESFRDPSCELQIGQVLKNGWTTPSTDGYSWHVQNSICGGNRTSTPSASTGPLGDHTSGNGNFMYTEADSSGTALLELPCVQLNGIASPEMSFWYHNYGSNIQPLYIDVFSNGIWINAVESVINQTMPGASSPWRLKTVDLSNFNGQFVKIRFRSTDGAGNRGDGAIDDILFYENISKDISLTEIVTPNSSGCNPGSSSVSVRIQNMGSSTINSGEISITYQVNSGSLVSDTVNQNIAAGTASIFTFTQPITTILAGGNEVTVTSTLLGDTNTRFNVVKKTVINDSPGLPYYKMDFESLIPAANLSNYSGDILNGFVRTPSLGGPGTYMWHVQKGSAPYVNGQPPFPPGPPTGPSGDHTFATNNGNGRGTYMLVESDLKQLLAPNPPAVPDATLELPCVAFSLNSANEVILSYWYHMFGSQIGELYVDINDGVRWINGVDVIRGQQQFSPTDLWKERVIDLTQYTGISTAKIRFRAENAYNGNSGQGRGGDIAIDDIVLFEKAPIDIAMVRVLNPITDCGLSVSEQFRVRAQNVGSLDALQLNLGFEISFTPLGSDSIITFIGKDSAVGITILPQAFFDFNFRPINLSAAGKYDLKVWTENLADAHQRNDTIIQSISNSKKPFGYCEDFSTLLLNEQPNVNYVYANNWGVSSSSFYRFKPSIAGSGAGPINGHTGGINDMYMISDGMIIPGFRAFLTSSCYDLTTSQSADLSFWYAFSDPNDRLIVEVSSLNVGFIPVDTIISSGPINTWTQAKYSLADYIGNYVEVKFRYTSLSRGYLALDDFCISKTGNQEISVLSLTHPNQSSCSFGTNEIISFDVRNIGAQIIDSFQVILQVDQTFLQIPAGGLFSDTLWYFPATSFVPGAIDTVVLNQANWGINLSTKTNYFVNIKVVLPGEIDEFNNRIIDFEIIHENIRTVPYFVDFENIDNEGSGPKYSNGFKMTRSFYNTNYFWTEKKGMDSPGLTGPSADHTLKDSTGNYMVTQSSNFSNRVTMLTSPCIDISGVTHPSINYYYHMFGINTGQLFLQTDFGNGWVTISSIQGQQQFSNNDSWFAKNINLTTNQGSSFRYRFVSVQGFGRASNMAVDDILVRDFLVTDIEETTNEVKELFRIFPNPNNGNFNLQVAAEQIGAHYQIFDMKGSVVATSRISTALSQIELNNVYKGVYFLKIEGVNKVEKLVIQ